MVLAHGAGGNEMALKVLFAGQKGGVGKSTLARAAAVTLAEQQMDVLIADFDTKQLTSLEWQARRIENDVEPEIEVASFKNLDKLKKIEKRYGAIVLDTRGHTDKDLIEMAQWADAVVLPTGVSMDDLAPTAGLVRHLSKKGVKPKRILTVLTRTGRSAKQIEDAREYLDLQGVRYLDDVFPYKDGYISVYATGRVGREAPHPSLRDAAKKVDAALLDFIKGLK